MSLNDLNACSIFNCCYSSQYLTYLVQFAAVPIKNSLKFFPNLLGTFKEAIINASACFSKYTASCTMYAPIKSIYLSYILFLQFKRVTYTN